MNFNNKKDFEEQLRQIKPSPVSSEVASKIRHGLERNNRAQRRHKIASLMTWGSVALAASVLITFGFMLFNGYLHFGTKELPELVSEPLKVEPESVPNNEPSDAFTPVLAENNLQNRIDEGIVFLRNGLTARRYRYQFMDRVVWKNPSNGAVVEMEIPRDEVILIPVQTY